MRLLLTDRFVTGAKATGKARQVDYYDTKTPGLALRVSDSHKGWHFVFTAPGVSRLPASGNSARPLDPTAGSAPVIVRAYLAMRR